jgi:hypothetical protein
MKPSSAYRLNKVIADDTFITDHKQFIPMKNNLSLILLVLINLLLACKKDRSASGLVGEWELRTEIDKRTGTSTNYLPGNGTILKFTETDYEMYFYEKFIKSGTYSVKKYIASLTKKPAERIVYDNGLDSGSANSFFKIDSNKLSIYIDNKNAPAAIYKKIKS